MDILIVDGYNIIGAWPELRELRDVDLALARDRLVERMAEYQAFTGCKVIIVLTHTSYKEQQKICRSSSRSHFHKRK